MKWRIMQLTKAIATNSPSEEVQPDFGDRILTLLQEQKRSKSWLANEIGVSKQALNYLLNHSNKPKLLNEMAFALEVNPKWLATGEGVMTNTPDNASAICQIPLLPMNAVNSDQPLREHETIVIGQAASHDCFAIKLENTSMEPLFNQNSILIFNPSKKPRSGDFIIFSTKKTRQIFFRQYFIDGNDIYLKSFDSMYKNFKNENIIIHGVLIESRNEFK